MNEDEDTLTQTNRKQRVSFVMITSNRNMYGIYEMNVNNKILTKQGNVKNEKFHLKFIQRFYHFIFK